MFNIKIKALHNFFNKNIFMEKVLRTLSKVYKQQHQHYKNY